MSENEGRFETIISARELNQNLNRDDIAIVDCRFDLFNPDTGCAEYKAEHIPGAVYAHLDKDLSSPPTPVSSRHPLPDWNEFQQKLGSWGIDRGTQVVVYDHSHGGFAGRLWWMLRVLGHNAVAVLNGGWSAWTRAGYEVETGVTNNSQKTFDGKFISDWIVNARRILENLEKPQLLLIDSRDPARYRGDEEPIDAKAGHIPGALNHSFEKNLTKTGEFLPVDQLKQQFAELIGEKLLEDVVVYCGSGVSACQNLLALEHAGFSGAKLYPGSWSEWSRNPELPFNTGDQP